MKSMDKFKKKSVFNLSKIYGGVWKTSFTKTCYSSEGCYTTETECYEDNNGNGKKDAGESSKIYSSTICP